MKRIAAVVTVAGLLVISTNTVQAENVYPNDYQKIQSTELVEVSIDQDGNEVESIIHRNFNRKTSRKPNRKAGIGKVIKTTKQLMALGKEVYKIVETGKPVVNFSKNNAVSIVPKPSDGTPVDPMNLQGWKIPKNT